MILKEYEQNHSKNKNHISNTILYHQIRCLKKRSVWPFELKYFLMMLKELKHWKKTYPSQDFFGNFIFGNNFFLELFKKTNCTTSNNEKIECSPKCNQNINDTFWTKSHQKITTKKSKCFMYEMKKYATHNDNRKCRNNIHTNQYSKYNACSN